MIEFAIGFIVGSFVGVATCALCVAAGEHGNR